MTRDQLRFTGEWPPEELWDEFPNWEYALDEEETPGQDETTLRPAAIQDRITGDEALTVGFVTLPAGQQCPAVLELDFAVASGVTVITAEGKLWRVVRLGRPPRWEPYIQSWLPLEERSHSVVSLEDATVFPLLVESRLQAPDGRRLRFVIEADGRESHERSG